MLDRNQQPSVYPIEQWDIPSPERITLPNGVEANVLNVGENDVVRVDVVVKGGRWQQECPLQAVFANRMVREGTRRYTSMELAERLDYYGAWLELSCAAEYAFITLYSLNKYLPQTLEVLESVVKEPAFPEKELHTLVENNIQQFRVNSARVDFLAHRALVNALYGDTHPCGYLVEEADYRRMCPALLQAFHERYYHAGNCTLYLSGKVTGDCLKRVEELFGTEPFGQGGASPGRIDFPVVTVPQKRVFVERADSLQSAVRMGMLTIDRHHADFMKLRVLVTLLGGYFGSRLMSNIREEKGYTYGVFANILSNPGSGLFLIHAETANEYVEPLIREVYAEMDKLRNEPVPAEELSMVQNYMRGEMCRNYESAFSLADAWIFLQTSGLEPSYYQEALETIRQVTPQDIGEMANKYLCKDNLKEIVSGKKIS